MTETTRMVTITRTVTVRSQFPVAAYIHSSEEPMTESEILDFETKADTEWQVEMIVAALQEEDDEPDIAVKVEFEDVELHHRTEGDNDEDVEEVVPNAGSAG